MVKVKILKPYFDVKLERGVDKDEELEVSNARGKELSDLEIVEIIEIKKTKRKKKK